MKDTDKPCPKAGDGFGADRRRSPSTVTPRKDGVFLGSAEQRSVFLQGLSKKEDGGA